MKNVFVYDTLLAQSRKLPYKGLGKKKIMLSQHILFFIKRYAAMTNEFKYSKVKGKIQLQMNMQLKQCLCKYIFISKLFWAGFEHFILLLTGNMKS